MDSTADPLAEHRLTDDEIDDLLRESGWGVLSTCRDGVPYSVPLSFGYAAPDAAYFAFVGTSAEGRKVQYAAATRRAGLLAFDVNGPADWRSVYVEGPLERVHVDEWDTAREALAANGWHPQLYAEVDADKGSDPRVWALRIEETGGRRVERA
jgi:hypothetical protein